MTFYTSDFPQADKLEQVGKVAIAISKGNHTDNAIESYINLKSSGRQGRYYRLAAEILGLVINTDNHAELTPVGKEYSSLSTDSSRIDFLGRCLIETKVFHEGLKYIHEHNPDDRKLKLWFRTLYPGEKTTADRRFCTFISYLNDTKIVEKSKGLHQIKKYKGGILKNKEENELTGKPTNKNKNTRVPSKLDNITYTVDAQKTERANKIHWELVVAKSQYLHNLGFQPFENTHIDLYVNNKQVILYEMKSLNQDPTNFISQARKAISQLYEYRYIFDLPQANLCIVTNSAIPNSNEWYLKYLTNDRHIAYEWTDDFVNFNTDTISKNILGEFF